MGLLTDFTRSLANGTGNTLLDRLCRQNGWDIDERHGNTIVLYFTGDHITPMRKVLVADAGGESSCLCFRCNCRAAFSVHTLPDNLPAAMLLRNDDVTIGGWAAKADDGEVKLSLQYTALADGMSAASFNLICNLMLKEVAEVEGSLHSKGLL